MRLTKKNTRLVLLHTTLFRLNFTQHPRHRFRIGELPSLVEGKPADIICFVILPEWFGRVGFEQKPNVVMQMLRYLTPGRNGMYVNVEHGSLASEPKCCQAGFFLRFLHGHSSYIGVAIGMTTRLQPAVQLTVMNQYDLPLFRRGNQCRRSNMTGKQRPLEALRISLHKSIGGVGHGLFVGIGGLVLPEECEQRLAVHGLGVWVKRYNFTLFFGVSEQ